MIGTLPTYLEQRPTNLSPSSALPVPCLLPYCHSFSARPTITNRIRSEKTVVTANLSSEKQIRSSMKRGITLFVVAAVFPVDTASASNEWVPRKNWATIGYESFFGKRPDKRAVVKISTKSKELATQKLPPPTLKTIVAKKKGDDSNPSGATKALMGLAVAVGAAVVGGKALSGDLNPELALVEAMRKPVVARNVPLPVSTKTIDAGATIPNEIFNLGTYAGSYVQAYLQ